MGWDDFPSPRTVQSWPAAIGPQSVYFLELRNLSQINRRDLLPYAHRAVDRAGR